MSKIEKVITDKLKDYGVDVEILVPMPISDWPWKTSRSRGSPKCDISIPEGKIYVEVKGFMTIYAMAKMAWLCKQNFNYYIFQATESDWNPYDDQSLLERSVKNNIEVQIQELVSFSKYKSVDISKLSLIRLEDYIKTRIKEYNLWNRKSFPVG